MRRRHLIPLALAAVAAPAVLALPAQASVTPTFVAAGAGASVCQGDLRPDASVGRVPLPGTLATDGKDVDVRPSADGLSVDVEVLQPGTGLTGVVVVGTDGNGRVYRAGDLAPVGAASTLTAPAAADGSAQGVSRTVACVSDHPTTADSDCPALSPSDVAVTLTDAPAVLRRESVYRWKSTGGAPVGIPVLWNRWTSDDGALTPLSRAELTVLPDVVLHHRSGCHLDVTLASYATDGPTWPTSGTQVFLGVDRVRLSACARSAILQVPAPTGYGQVDLYTGRTVFDGSTRRGHGPLPHYPDVQTPGNGALISAWNGGFVDDGGDGGDGNS